MKISEIKDPLVRKLAYKRQLETTGENDHDFFFNGNGCFVWKNTPEGEDFWIDVFKKRDVQHYPCYPSNAPLDQTTSAHYVHREGDENKGCDCELTTTPIDFNYGIADAYLEAAAAVAETDKKLQAEILMKLSKVIIDFNKK